MEPIVTHHNCHRNQTVGLTARHLVDNNPQPEWLCHTPSGTRMLQPNKEVLPGWTQKRVYAKAFEVAKRFVGGRKIQLAPRTDYINKYSGGKRDDVTRKSNAVSLWGKMQWGVRAFVKSDKYTPDLANSKAPRMIQYRDAGTNCELSRFMGPAEHELLLGPGLGPTATPSCSKGMNLNQRAQVWLQKSMAFKDAVCFKADYSKFDAHVHTHALKLEHSVWRDITGHPLPFLDNQLKNNGRTDTISYQAVGTRMSGDRNTGGGNSILNIVLTYTCAAIAGIECEMLCDGDDSMVWMSKDDAVLLGKVAENVIPKVFGMQWEYEVVDRLVEQEYCHTRLSMSGLEPKCMVEPLRHVQRMFYTVNRCSPRLNAQILVGNLFSALLLYPNQPIIAPIAMGWLKKLGALEGNALKICHVFGEMDRWRAEQVKEHCGGNFAVDPTAGEVSSLARAETHEMFGISPEDQVLYERAYLTGSVVADLKFIPMKQPKFVERETLRTTGNELCPLW